MAGWEPFLQLGVSGVLALVLWLVIIKGDLRTRYEADAWKQRADRAEKQVDRLLPAMEAVTEQAKALTEQTRGLTEQTRVLVGLIRNSLDRDDPPPRAEREPRRTRERVE